MRKKKYVLRPLELWLPGAIEQWLEEEAARGWYLTDCGPRLAKLERRKPAVCRVRVQPCRPEPEERWKERFAAYEAMGWVFAASITTDFEVFYCGDPTAPELQTDPVAWGWAWEKPLRRAKWEGLFCLLLFPLLAALSLFLDDSPLEFLLSMPVPLLASYLIAPLLAVYGVRELLAVRRARRALAAGLTPEFRGNWRKSRRWWRLFALLYAAYWLVCGLGGLLWWELAEPDALTVPVVSVTTLAPDSGPEDWEIDFDSFNGRESPLRPAHLELRRYDGGGREICLTGDRLCAAFLAGAAYREKLAEQKKLWPDAAETPIADSRFDEAVLLETGEGACFLARRGRAVTSARVNFPVDLAAHLDDFAAALAEGK